MKKIKITGHNKLEYFTEICGDLRIHIHHQNLFLQCLLTQLAPTLLDLKPASLLNFTDFHHNFYQQWQSNKSWLFKIWFPSVFPDHTIHYEEIITVPGQRCLVFFYQPRQLAETLYQKANQQFLADYGYPPETDIAVKLTFLKDKLMNGFPHEIGIFLGIPHQDVAGFIKHHGKNYLFSKYWKVYDNPVQSLRLFNQFDKARNNIIAILQPRHR